MKSRWAGNHLSRLGVETPGQTKSGRAGWRKINDGLVQLRGTAWIVRIRIFDEDLNRLGILRHRVVFLSFVLMDCPKLFQIRHTAWTSCQIFSQQRFRKPVILPLECFIDKGVEGLPGRNQGRS